MNTFEKVETTRGDAIDIAQLWGVVWRFKYLIAATTIVAGLIAVVLALTAVPVFRSEVAIAEVKDGNMGAAASLANQIGGIASIVGLNLAAGGGAGREAQALLNSRRLAEEFISRNNLLPLLFPNGKQPATLWLGVRDFRQAVLSIRDDKRSGLTVVSMSWTDPETAAKWANGYVALANELLRARAMSESEANIAYLRGQIEKTDVVELRRVMYNLIESEMKTLMLANAKPEYAFAILDPAVPPEVRFSPRRTLMVLLGLALGLAVGLSAAFVLNSVGRFRTDNSK